eukprot:Pompholyxophrys_punicea_v1_NODE_138_length_3259_cov_5.175094.p4 type:complete len:104 gc:universal NODE_138_length_3259_cov_5.175094:549-238(-)
MDGASIHLDKFMTDYFHSRGIIVLFLPSYCPFFNPIEVVFGLVKRRCRELYDGTEEHFVLAQVLMQFSNGDFSKIFKHCGYHYSGYFSPETNFHQVLVEGDMI